MRNNEAWVVTVDMGYGHQRAAYPFRDIAHEGIITANSSKLLSKWEIKAWKRYRRFYEWISRATSIPVIGRFLFNIYDKLQKISDIYPVRDLSKSSFPVIYCDYLIKKKKINQSMFTNIAKTNLPVLTTFFFTALAAENAGVKRVYCIATDTDINRAWVARNPSKSSIHYFAPTDTAARRLRLYGVPENHITMTGFPLPKEAIGGRTMTKTKKDLGKRLANLDPHNKLPEFYTNFYKKVLGKYYKKKSSRTITITFAIGGAGAQTELALSVVKSLKQKILDNKIKLIITAGTKPDVLKKLEAGLIRLGLNNEINKRIVLLFCWSKVDYFKKFSDIMRETDILWTKPSELSFYCALGIPIIIAPPIGSHEFRNQEWLISKGTGINQQSPEYANEWLFDLIESGRFAEAAMSGFIEVPKLATYDIERIVLAKPKREKPKKSRR